MDIGQLVIRNDDDRDVPTLGRVTGWKDDETCMVLWGDYRFYPVSAANEPSPEPYDQLATWLGQRNRPAPKLTGALWIEWDDESGESGSARWGNVSDEVLDDVLKLVKYILGNPDTVT